MSNKKKKRQKQFEKALIETKKEAVNVSIEEKTPIPIVENKVVAETIQPQVKELKPIEQETKEEEIKLVVVPKTIKEPEVEAHKEFVEEIKSQSWLYRICSKILKFRFGGSE